MKPLQRNKNWNTEELEDGVKRICLPFLRISSMLQRHLYSEEYPKTNDDVNEEFKILIQFLSIGENSSSDQSLSKLLIWCCEDPKQLMQTWAQEYMSFVSKVTIAARV